MTLNSHVINFGEIEAYLNNAVNRSEAYSEKYLCDLICEKIDYVNPKLISVDVFDTILLRTDESEIKRFRNVAKIQSDFLNEKYGYNFDWRELLYARLTATKMSYTASKVVRGCREGSFTEINNVICSILNVDSEISEKLEAIELEYELGCLFPNSGLIELLGKYKDKIELCLISDMYLHKHHITYLLDRKVPHWSKIFTVLYSSADTKVSKASGLLFDDVKNDFQFQASEMLHIGDSYIGDILKPSEKGMYTIYTPICTRSRELRQKCELECMENLKKNRLDIRYYSA